MKVMLNRETLRMMERTVKNWMKDNPTLVQYIKDEWGIPTGVVVATVDITGDVVYGYSACNKEKGDTFSRYFGLFVALERAFKVPVKESVNRPEINRVLQEMKQRAQKYFQQVVV